PPRQYHPPADGCRAASGCGHRRRTGPPLGRHRVCPGYHRRSRPSAARLAKGVTMKLSVNGREVFVATGGRDFDPALPAVMLLHGAGFDHSTWALHSRWFAHHGFAVLAPDLPGHGRSGGKPLATIAEMADWVAGLIEAAGATSARLVGHSMGSLIALETAARYPAKVSA